MKMVIIRTDQYVAMEEEEFKLSDDDIKWLLCHTEYDDKELNTMLAGQIIIVFFSRITHMSHTEYVGRLYDHKFEQHDHNHDTDAMFSRFSDRVPWWWNI